jgi:hypothetical protein
MGGLSLGKDCTMRRILGMLVLLLSVSVVSAGGSDDSDGFVPLFNGTDLTGFYTWLEGHGKNNDLEKVFSVQDGLLRISGKVWGGLITEKEYENYHLRVEYRWGEKTWPPREEMARDSGILLHCVGPEGAVNGLWMQSVECNIMEGRTGDFILFSGKSPTKLTVEAENRGGQWYFKRGAPLHEFGMGEPITRIFWSGREPYWKDVKNFCGKADVEKPPGEWNHLECICHGDRITTILNGKIVNAGVRASPSRGKIFFQSEAAEIFFRKIELKMLTP